MDRSRDVVSTLGVTYSFVFWSFPSGRVVYEVGPTFLFCDERVVILTCRSVSIDFVGL